MIIIAGTLRVDPADRDRYLAAVADVTRAARAAPGCLDFVQAPDPLDPERIVIHEQWESDEDLQRFRSSGGPEPDLPPLRSADVHKYRIAAVEPP
ncbi:antibiotic biosynthesis monooxygenase [Haloactinopolyspora alba]|uniref:Antibiotic biosynthesis monooxygenase n=1 Tax=Haloactinopolyspora alba TaxID=648780 RepID=A0A2P8DWR4_9ACTN|nr:antibiotic biosynthesis monooxygenase family protein [Haloactinopolyspora alba]PSL01607.1 antibiotic biosynthesis monooxygenase [Haloactinopolyspora alba]